MVKERDLSKKVNENSSGATSFCLMMLKNREEREGVVEWEWARMRVL